jgi:hypothetical protein
MIDARNIDERGVWLELVDDLCMVDYQLKRWRMVRKIIF